MITLEKPYWFADKELPGLDFNREIVEPGTNPEFPNGAVGIRVDDDFWCVAALPLEEYRNVSLIDIVAALWPSYQDEATYTPDHGSEEQRHYFAATEIDRLKKTIDHLEKRALELRNENDRLKQERPDISSRRPSRVERHTSYFVRQYETLLIAMAHEGVARTDEKKGLCSICGLYMSDRVHQKKWIARHEEGYDPDYMYSHLSSDD